VAVASERVRLVVAGPGGGWTATLPARLREGHAAELAELRTAAKEAGRTLAAERLRVEALLATERTWRFADWARMYRDHPLTGAWGRRLLWSVSHGLGAGADGWATVRVEGDRLVDAAGEPVEVGDGTLVRPWHPLVVAPAEVQAWRAALDERELRQPFKQAWREVYLLTPAEEATGTYSNRFAAHILQYGQAYALMRSRDWAAPALGYWDGGADGTATRVFPGGRWRAQFFHALVERADDERTGMATLCATDQVRFERRTGRAWEAAPLREVPPLVFSEAMRDVDLFVGVASIAADPTWTDRGDDPHAGYWHEASFGELTESAATRRSALERIVPRTKIADRATIDGRFLRVRGRLRSYKIHLGSGNVLMEPDDQYLCIVPAPGRGRRRIFLPFEDDGGRLAVIVSKAFLLADDDRITDPGIVGQITGGRGGPLG
jgi:hypothetical protein